jgi:hypothetical protein
MSVWNKTLTVVMSEKLTNILHLHVYRSQFLLQSFSLKVGVQSLCGSTCSYPQNAGEK